MPPLKCFFEQLTKPALRKIADRLQFSLKVSPTPVRGFLRSVHRCIGRSVRHLARPGRAGLQRSGTYLRAGFPLFVAGLAIVRAHNRWEVSLPVVVTVVGWLALLSGLSRILFPTRLSPIAVGAVHSTGVLPAVVIVCLVVGAFLSFKGYSRE
jgi:hypothetical protein